MSVMSEVFVTITEGLEQGVAIDEIAYALTCEYPEVDMATALGMISSVIEFEQMTVSKL